jgi:cell division protein FtsQ
LDLKEKVAVERVPPFRNRVERRSPSHWAVLFIFLFFVTILFILFLRSPLSHISTITVSGQHILSKQEILQSSGIRPGMSFFGVKTEEAKVRLMKLRAVKQVELDKQFPSTIAIRVVEHPIVAYIQDDQRLMPLLANGVFFPSHPVTTMWQALPLFIGWDLQQSSFLTVTSQFAHLPASLRRHVLTVRPMKGKPGYVVLWTRKGHKVETRINTLTKKMKLYPSFLNQPPGTIHLFESVWFTPE